MTEWNSADIRLHDLRVLSVVLEHVSLTRAAEALGTTQSSVSKVLARLRVRFGDPLLLRSGQSMRLTPKALEIAAPLRELLAAADSMRAPRPPFEAQSSERIFRVLVSDVGMIRFLPPLIARMQKEGPKLRVDAVPLGSLHFAAKLEAGDADLALGAFPRAPQGLRKQRLYFDGYVSVARQGATGATPSQEAQEVCAAGHIVVTASDTGHAAHQMVQHALEWHLRRSKCSCACQALLLQPW